VPLFDRKCAAEDARTRQFPEHVAETLDEGINLHPHSRCS